MRIAVMGTGGVGGYFGGLLAQGGHEVTFIARGAHLAAIRQQGLRVQSTYGDFAIAPAQATDRPDEIGPVELVIFAVKAYDVESAARLMRPLVSPQTTVLPLQNGVDIAERVGRIVGDRRVTGGLCYVSAAIAAPGVIRQAGRFRRIIAGELNGQESARCRRIVDVLREVGVEAELATDIQAAIWTKFLFICAASGMAAVTEQTIGPIMSDPDTREMYATCLKEVEAVARAQNIALAPDVVAHTLRMSNNAPPDMKPSMLHDLEVGNRLEVDALNGTVARLGRELDVPTPVNRFISTVLKHRAG